jgi:DNA-binding response OmpR family regulator
MPESRTDFIFNLLSWKHPIAPRVFPAYGSIMKENELSQAARRPAHHFNEAQHSILVVEDEANIRKANTEVLTDSGYHVDGAEDGAIAWSILQLKRYHLVVTDNKMPKVTGVELLKKLHAARMGVLVIMTTGILPEEQFALYPWIRPAAVLLKPYTLVELLDTVKKVLRTISDE